MYVSLGFLVASASFDVLFHEFPKSWPFVLFANEFPSIRDARMSSCRGVMKSLKDVSSQIWVVFKENFVGICGFCWHEEVIRKKDTWFVGIHPLVKVFSSQQQISHGVC